MLPVGGNSSHSPSELSLLLVSETSLWLAEATASQGSQPSGNSLPTMLTFCLDRRPQVLFSLCHGIIRETGPAPTHG